MVKSMTGYGRGKKTNNERQVEVEINSVNNRYLDTNIRMAKPLISFKDNIRKIVEDNISRGKLDIYINYTSSAKEDYNVLANNKLCENYIETLKKLGKDFNLQDDISIMKVAQIPDIIQVTQEASDDKLTKQLIDDALEEAISELISMKSKEGHKLKVDMLSKSALINEMIGDIKDRSPLVVKKYKENLKEKIEELLSNAEIDETRLLTEVAIFADKTSVDEEITRLESHMDQLKGILEIGGVIGRKLDFLIQEINREVNTIGSKANDSIISSKVINLKSEIEKIREQVQNIE